MRTNFRNLLIRLSAAQFEMSLSLLHAHIDLTNQLWLSVRNEQCALFVERTTSA